MFGLRVLRVLTATLVTAAGDNCVKMTRVNNSVNTTVNYDGVEDAFVFADNRGSPCTKRGTTTGEPAPPLPATTPSTA